jgi:hypothetical protein
MSASHGGAYPSTPSATPPSTDMTGHLEPCAATSSMFLYAQGSTIVCLQQDTLVVLRRFQQHSEDVTLIAVDNVSELGNGRLVVSYDKGMNAIVWDTITGDEIARFAAFEHIRTATWMKNGVVAFGLYHSIKLLQSPLTIL